MTREKQIMNGFTEMMRGFWGNQDLKVPDLETPRKQNPGKMTVEEYQNKLLIDELSKMPLMVLSTAYLYALNCTRYGADVTKEWLTAVQQSSALEKAYMEGYHDAIQRMREESEEET